MRNFLILFFGLGLILTLAFVLSDLSVLVKWFTVSTSWCCHGLGGFELGVDSMHLSYDEECAAYNEGAEKSSGYRYTLEGCVELWNQSVNKHECMTASCFSV